MMAKTYSDYHQLFAEQKHPLLFVDEEALVKNIQWALAQAQNKKIRIATKSLRSVEVFKKIQAFSPNFQGLMTYTLEESLWLRQLGFKDILMGYPTMDISSLNELAKDTSEITLMVDRVEHLDFLDSLAKKNNSIFSICIDIDLSMDLPGLRFGVYRSAIQTLEELKSLLLHLKTRTHLKLVGVMGYEAQIAGVGDKRQPLIQALKKISLRQLQSRRKSMVKLIEEFGYQLTLVNGGGTGSVFDTVTEDVVTEVTIGSAFFAPTLFDAYSDFSLEPAMGFTLSVVRNPSPNIFTLLGGGYIASGSIGNNKAPSPYLPEGLSLLTNEGAGEVQTPVINKGTHKLKIGDFVIMRHAKAGEPCERFNEIILVKKNGLEKIKTYRGEGKCFL